MSIGWSPSAWVARTVTHVQGTGEVAQGHSPSLPIECCAILVTILRVGDLCHLGCSLLQLLDILADFIDVFFFGMTI